MEARLVDVTQYFSHEMLLAQQLEVQKVLKVELG